MQVSDLLTQQMMRLTQQHNTNTNCVCCLLLFLTMASEALSPEAQVLYILSTLHRQKLLTRRERNLLKGTV